MSKPSKAQYEQWARDVLSDKRVTHCLAHLLEQLDKEWESFLSPEYDGPDSTSQSPYADVLRRRYDEAFGAAMDRVGIEYDKSQGREVGTDGVIADRR